MKSLTLAFLLLYVALTGHAYAESSEDLLHEEDIPEAERGRFYCGSEELHGGRFKFCYRDPGSTNSDDIIYFFHGLGGSEKTWHRQCLGTKMIQDWWDLNGYRPRIVTVSFGPQWLLVNNKKYSLISYFTKVVMPLMEKRMGGLRNGKRHIIGQSMGGYNGALISLKNPGMFSRVAMLCPAITTIGPFDSSRSIESYIARTGASRRLVDKMLGISRSVFVNEKDWEEHDPLRLLKKYSSSRKPRFYVSIGMMDGYGFQEGSEKFVRMAGNFSFLFSWVPVPGPHCNFKRIGTANFIMGD